MIARAIYIYLSLSLSLSLPALACEIDPARGKSFVLRHSIRNKYVAEMHAGRPFRRRLKDIPNSGTKPRSGHKKTKIEGLCNLDRALAPVHFETVFLPRYVALVAQKFLFRFASQMLVRALLATRCISEYLLAGYLIQ